MLSFQNSLQLHPKKPRPSLVGVFYVSLVFIFQCRHHRVIALMHHCLYVLRTLTYWVNRLVDCKFQWLPCNEMPVLGAWHHVKRTIDGKRHHRQLQLVGKQEGSLLELSHVSGE